MSDMDLSSLMTVEELGTDLGLEVVGGYEGLSSLDEIVDILGIGEGGALDQTACVAEEGTWRHTFSTEDKWPI